MRELNTIGRYWRKKYNTKVYKIPISIPGFTCPNIDGTVAKGGCTFCENDSFAPNLKEAKSVNSFKLNPQTKENKFLPLQLEQLKIQFKSTKAKLQKKFGAKKYIVYFQSFTNTYAPFDTLKALYDTALSFEDVIGISIGTRADSISDEILNYLQKLSTKPINLQNSKPKTSNLNPKSYNLYPNFEVWVEYGVQSIFDETLKKINRGEDYKTIKETILKTKKLGLKVCAHLIFGLPGETQEMMLKSVKEVIDLEVDAIKFHPLYVVKKTILTKEYLNGKFKPISKELYIDTLIKAIKMLPDNIMIQRVTAGINDDSLLAPMWCKCKHTQIKDIKEALLKNNLKF